MRDRSRSFGGRFRSIAGGGDAVVPTLLSAVINSIGATVTLTFSEITNGHAGFSFSGGTATSTYSSGDGGLTKTFTTTGFPPYLEGEVITLSYVPGNVLDTAGNALAAFSGFAVTNNSTNTRPSLVAKTVSANGTTVTLTFSESVSGGAGGGFSLNNNGSVALTYVSGNGTSTLVFTAASTVYATDIPTLDYTPGSIADTTGALMAAVSGASVTNNSTVGYALIAHTFVAGTANGGTTPQIVTTGANLIVIGVPYFIGAGTPILANEITDSASNTWQALTDYNTALDGGVRLFYCFNPNTSGTHTFTVAHTGEFPSLYVLAYSGSAGSPDQQAGTSGQSGGTIQPGSITPGFAHELIVTIIYTTSTATPTIDSGYTVIDNAVFNSGVSIGGAIAYKVQSAAAAVNPTWTVSSGAIQASCTASFKAA